MPFRNFILILFISILNGTIVRSQSSFSAIWLDYNHSKKISDKWTLNDDFGYRFRFVGDDVLWQRLHGRASVDYQMKEVKVGAGIFSAIIFNQSGTKYFEIRPFQYVKYSWPKGERIRLDHFVRLEERMYFLEKFNPQIDNYFELKFRYGLLLKYHLNPNHQTVGRINLLAGIEPFFNLFKPNELIDLTNNRSTLGLEMQVLMHLTIRITYIYETFTFPVLQNTDVFANKFRFSFIQKF